MTELITFGLKYKNPINLLRIKRLWSILWRKYCSRVHTRKNYSKIFSHFQNVYYRVKSINFNLKIIQRGNNIFLVKKFYFWNNFQNIYWIINIIIIIITYDVNLYILLYIYIIIYI